MDIQYEALMKKVLEEGVRKSDRTGTGTLSLFGPQLRYDVSSSVPLITSKQTFWKSAIKELLWIIDGNTNIKALNKQNCHIWDAWADEDGDLGLVYGYQWRRHRGIDQLAEAIELLKNDPMSRRIIVNSWSVEDLNDMALPPCHCLYQFWSDGENLSLKLYQRSADLPVGVPFNLFEYSALLYMVATVVGMKPKDFIWTAGDAHIYLNQVDQVEKQLSQQIYDFPVLNVKHKDSIDDFKLSDFEVIGYKHSPKISYKVAV